MGNVGITYMGGITVRNGIKRSIAACLLLASLFLLPVLASGSSAESTRNADILFDLGLFKGTSKGYELDQSPTRIQGIIMLIRLLGEEDEALSCDPTQPFGDVPAWATQYVAYALAKGYTNGTSSTTFGTNARLDAKSYVTFVLRAMGYHDSNGDFSWSTALADSATFGLMTSQAASALSQAGINRGDMVDLSCCALTMPMSGETKTLAQKLVEAGVIEAEKGKKNGVLGNRIIYTYVSSDASTVEYARKTLSLASGKVTADILSVNLNNQKVSVKSALVNNTLGATAPFKQIVSQSGAKAVINSNFFQAYDSFKIPIGHIVCDGQFMYGVSGLSALGIKEDNSVVVGRPSVFYRVAVSGNDTKNWACYEMNSLQQTKYNSVLYTPAYGKTLKITCEGLAVLIEQGAITRVLPCVPGGSVPIPANGCIMWLGSEFTATDYYQAPEIGEQVSLTPYLFKEDEEGFSLDNIVSVVSGAPRLVKDGQMVTYLDPGFSEARFTTASTPRTAIGTLANGRLLLVSVGSATIQQMRELMLTLGCVDAINLDGGASTAMYYNGSYLRSPGRALTTTLQVFVAE